MYSTLISMGNTKRNDYIETNDAISTAKWISKMFLGQ